MLDKTQLSFFLLLGGVYIARIGELFSCELAQMIFGLLKKTILCSGKYRDWCLKALFFRRSGVSKEEGRNLSQPTYLTRRISLNLVL